MRAIFARQFSSLTIYNYRVYFFGQMVSNIGTWMQTTGQAWLVLRITGSPLALGTVTTLQFLPITILSLFGGVVADRFPKRKFLMFTQTTSMLQAAVLFVLVATDTVQLWHIYVLAVILGTTNSFDSPTRQSFPIELVGREHLANAVALNSTMFNTARILGPSIAGIVISTAGLPVTFLCNSLSFLGALTALALMRPREMRALPPRRPGGNVFRQIGEGLSYAAHTPRVLYLFILLGFIGTFGYNFTVIIPLVAEFVLNVGPSRFGLLTSFLGAGSLIAAMGLAGFGAGSPRVALLAALGFVALFALLAASPWYWATAVLFLCLGFAGLTFTKTISTNLQLTVPDELRGRIMSINFLLVAGSTPLGGYLTGLLSEAWGVPAALGAESALCGLGVLLAVAYWAAVGRRQPESRALAAGSIAGG